MYKNKAICFYLLAMQFTHQGVGRRTHGCLNASSLLLSEGLLLCAVGLLLYTFFCWSFDFRVSLDFAHKAQALYIIIQLQ